MRISTFFDKSDDVYLLRIICNGEGLYVVYDSVGHLLGVMEGDYEPWDGSHLLGLASIAVTELEFRMMRSRGRYTPPNRR